MIRWFPSYNSPIILTFSLICFAIRLLDSGLWPGLSQAFFAVGSTFHFNQPLDYWRLVSHVFGHRDLGHLTANLSVILLIGPILEEKYGSKRLLLMMAVTALVTGILNVAFLSTGLMGASGLVFMMILLGSFANSSRGEIPLTFILIVAVYLSREIAAAFQRDEVSQFAHLLGGVSGSVFGFLQGGKGTRK